MALRLTGATSNSGTMVGQRIEAANIQDLAGLPASLEVYGQCSSATTVTWKTFYPNSTDNWAAATQIATGTFSFTTSGANYTTTFTLPSNVTAGMAIEFDTGALGLGAT